MGYVKGKYSVLKKLYPTYMYNNDVPEIAHVGTIYGYIMMSAEVSYAFSELTTTIVEQLSP